MSIREYNVKNCIVNEITNERIIVPKVKEENNKTISVQMEINDFLLMQIVMEEYNRTGRITIIKEYMRD